MVQCYLEARYPSWAQGSAFRRRLAGFHLGSPMHAQFKDGSLLLRFGWRFGISETERLSETILSFAPLTQLTLDFTKVREFHDSACSLLAAILGANRALKVVLRGLTLHQSALLRCFGVEEPGFAAGT